MPPSEVSTTDAGAKGDQSMPLGLQYAASEALGAEDPTYAMAAAGSGGYSLANATNSYSAYVSAGGLHVSAGGDAWSLGVIGVGYAGATSPLGSATATATANRVEYDYGAISQWFVNGPLGLQQGFTLAERPSAADAGAPLTVDLSVGGSFVATADPSGTSVTLAAADGSTSLVYGGLVAYDAAGAAVPARLVVTTTDAGQTISILVDDSAAQYPLTIDPYVQQLKVTSNDAAPAVSFGSSVSITPSGTFAVVGARSSAINSVPGSVYVFSGDGASWSQSARLFPSDSALGDEFGSSVSISADGTTLVVGARSAPVGGAARGAAYVFTRTGTAWTQAQKVVASDGAAGDQFGFSVSGSANGAIFVVGAPFADVNGQVDQGAAYVFAKSGANWPQAAKLTAFDGAAGAVYGYSTTISGSGQMVAVGAPSAAVSGRADQGAVYAYFSGVGSKMVAGDGAASEFFGFSLATNDDGSLLLIGSPYSDVAGRANQGAAYFFFRSWTNWYQTTKLTASDGAASANFGLAVSLNAAGTKAAVAAPFADVGANARQGAVYVFSPSTGATWAQTDRITASDGVANDLFGQSLAINGTAVLAGAPTVTLDIANPSQGVAYFFYQAPVLTVIANPANQVATVGVPTTFTASSAGPAGRTVRWQVSTDGTTWVDVPGANQSWYTITPALADSGKSYRAVFSDPGGGAATTAAASLTVVKAATTLKITTSVNPRGLNDPLSITVAAASAVPGLGIPNGGTISINIGTNNFSGVLINGLAVFNNVPLLDAVGTYLVTATYDGANDPTFASAAATYSQVVVRSTPGLTGVVPQQATPGQAVTVSAFLTVPAGTANLAGGVMVLDNGVPIAFPQLSTTGGVTSASYTIPSIAVGVHRYQFVFLGNPSLYAAATGVYTLAAGANASAAAAPTPSGSASPPAVATAAAGVSAAAGLATTVGVPVTLTAAAAGITPRSVQWQGSFDGASWADVFGATQPWFTFTPTLAMSGIQYRALFSDLAGNYEASTATTVNVAKAATLLNITTSANPRTYGSSLSIRIDATSSVAGLGVPNEGTISINIGSVNYSGKLVNGLAIFDIPSIPTGTYQVTAAYDGTNDPSFASAQGTATQVVVRGTPTLTANVPQQATAGQAVTISAILAVPAGVTNLAGGVVVLDNGTPVLFPQLSTSGGVTTATFTSTGFGPGTHRFQFVFLGNPQLYLAATGVYTMEVSAAASGSAARSVATSSTATPAASGGATAEGVSSLALADAFAATTTKKAGKSSSALSFWKSPAL